MYLDQLVPVYTARYQRWNRITREFRVKGEVEDWSGDGADTTVAEGGSPSAGSPKSKTPEPAVSENNRKTPPKPDPDGKPRIRLKTNLATDPALVIANIAVPNLKTELDASPAPSEYTLASLPPAIQSALVSRGLFLPPALGLGEPVAPRQAEAESRQPVAFQCLPCGIRFSSLSTLEAHQTYYCSHRANKNDDDSKSTNAEGSGNQSDVDGEPANKNQRTGKQYTCTHCSYSADKKVSLNRHMRMHTVSPGPATVSTTVPNGEPNADSQDRYCAECDIRFSSQKTYRAHKMHYCNSRHVVKTALSTNKPASSCTSGSSPTSPVDATTCRTPPSPGTQNPQQQPFLALPTNPILILPYSLFRSASVLPSLSAAAGLPNPDMPYVLLPNGALQPMSSAIASSSSHNSNSQSDVLKSANKPKENAVSRESSSAPLDLTVRKSPGPKDGPVDLRNEHEKENFKRSPSPEKIECVPSLHGSPPLTSAAFGASSPSVSVSPKRKHEETSRSNSPRLARTPKSVTEKSRSPEINPVAPFDIPASLHPLLMRAGTLPALFSPDVQMRLAELPTTVPPAMPQVLVKQGVSKCKECNIVFCKHENYVIHKKHYCSARNLEDDGSKASGSPPVSPRSGGTTSPATQYQQLICLACGIKFTSLDNLNAHQQYYCLKRGELETRKCGKCRGALEPGHQCPPPPPAVLTGWKCPCCDMVSTTASAAQRHMETHSAVKAYRCTICRYKGNTLRGMRTHIRMHFDKRSPDLQEEKYITYILETEGASVLEVPSPDERAASPESEGRTTEPLHHCNFCPYSSDYKANVQRHMKLIHESSPEEAVANGGDDKHMRIVDDEEEIIVKKEAIEPEVIIASVDDTPIIKKELVEPATTPKSKEEEATQEGRKYCKSCNISFTYYKSFLAHKKYYCLSHAGEISAANTNDNNNTTRATETSVL